MSSKTRIIVLHMKEIIYTAVFLALAVVLAVVLFFMFGPYYVAIPGRPAELYGTEIGRAHV